MKIFTRLKIAAVSVLIWETIASYYKNKDFKKQLDKASGFDKFRIIFWNIIEVNKKFFTEVSSYDYEWKYEEFKAYAEDKYKELNKSVDETLKNISDLTKEKANSAIKDLTDKAEDLKKKAEAEASNLKEKAKYEKKYEEVVEKIEKIKAKMKK